MCGIPVTAQLKPNEKNRIVLNTFQDTLSGYAQNMFSATTNLQRSDQNAKFIQTLVDALKTPSSFHFDFEVLGNISVVKSPDDSFRIIYCYILTEEGSYRFFGAIQMKTTDGKLKLYPLIDGTENFSDDNAITDNKKWFGARYYEIIPLLAAGEKP